MKPAPFTYHDPRSIADVVGLLGQHENARVLAGGQSLMPMLNFRYVMPDHLIDLNRVPGLSGIADAGDTLRIGAMTRQRDLEYSDIVAARCPVLRAALLKVGHRQTRNRGTIGGSLCHLDPSAEQVAAVALLGGTLHISGTDGERSMPFAEFGLGFMTTALAPDEVLTAIDLPLWPADHGWSWQEYARRHGDFAIAGAGALLTLDGAGRIDRAALVIAGLGAVPVRLEAGERMLLNEAPSEALFTAIAAEAETLEAMEDAYVTAQYRQHLAGVLCRRALREAAIRAKEGSLAHV